jgi:multiple sugar transport system substrate-binding protein
MISKTPNRRDFLRMGAVTAGAVAAGHFIQVGDNLAEAAPALASPPAGKLTVTVWGAQTDLTSLKAGISMYEKAFPQVKITLNEGGDECGVDEAACKPLIAAGTMPDIFVPGIWDYNSMVDSGILTDVTPLIARDKFNLGDFNQTVIRYLRALKDGHHYGLPMGYNMQGFYYNKTMFDKAGLKYPDPTGNYTWDDVRAWAKKLTIDGNGNTAESSSFNPKNIKQWGFTIIPAIGAQIEALLLSFGGSSMVPPAYQKCNLENPNTIKGLQFIQDMMYKDHTTVTPAVDQEQSGYLRWVTGHVAMQVGSHEQVTDVQAENPGMQFDYVALPKGPAGNASCLQIHIWAIYNKSQNQELAWHMVKYLATTAAGKFMGLIPAYTPKLGPDFLHAPGEPQHLYDAQILPSSWKLTQIPTFDNQTQAEITGQDGFGPAITNILDGKQTAAAAVKGIDAKVNALMQQSS